MREGERIGDRFLLQKRIDGGNRDRRVVWLAHDERLGRDVVLKRDLIDDSDEHARARLRAEPRAMAKFSHPHVITLYEVVSLGADGDWLVMEYAGRGSLDGTPRMSAEQAALIGAQIAGALAALHAAGVVHCDVKPGNIVLADDGTAKLTDFGAAYRVDSDETLSPEGPVSYTPAYAAPEVIRGSPEPRSDVYSLAATLYALAAGESPRAGQPMRTGSGPLDDVLSAMHRYEPEHRPDAAEAERLLASVASRPSRPRGAPTWVRRGRPVAVAAGASLIVSGAVVAALLLGWLPFLDRTPGEAAAPAFIIGDLRTADPCAMVDEVALRQFGETELDRDYANFERCDVDVTRGTDVINVEVAFDSRMPPEVSVTTKRVGKIRIVEFPGEPADCDRALVLPEGTDRALVWVSVDTSDGPAPLCDMADVAADRAAAVLDAGPLPRRSPPLPADSLIWEDACTVIDAERLALVPGLDTRTPTEIGFGNWTCDWNDSHDELYLAVGFDRGSPLSADDGQRVPVDDRDAYVERNPDGTCTAQVAHRDYSDEYADPAVEILYVEVGGKRPIDERCTLATDLAAHAASRLRRS